MTTLARLFGPLREISAVAALCSSTATAIVVMISFISPIVPPMPWMSATVPLGAVCMEDIWAEISSVALAVWVANRGSQGQDRPLHGLFQ